jgi:hypothetical protein
LAETRAGIVLSGLQVWRLGEARPDGLGLYCGADGLFLAGTPLIERRGADYRVRSPGEVERLLSCAYGAKFESEPIMRGLARWRSAGCSTGCGRAACRSAPPRLPGNAGYVMFRPAPRAGLRRWISISLILYWFEYIFHEEVCDDDHG